MFYRHRKGGDQRVLVTPSLNGKVRCRLIS